jgi:hypothetical protein
MRSVTRERGTRYGIANIGKDRAVHYAEMAERRARGGQRI